MRNSATLGKERKECIHHKIDEKQVNVANKYIYKMYHSTTLIIRICISHLGPVTQSIQVALNKSHVILEIRLLKRCKTWNLSLKTETWTRLERLRFAVLHRLSNRISGIKYDLFESHLHWGCTPCSNELHCHCHVLKLYVHITITCQIIKKIDVCHQNCSSYLQNTTNFSSS